jgi:hypothetical protein
VTRHGKTRLERDGSAGHGPARVAETDVDGALFHASVRLPEPRFASFCESDKVR